MKKEINDDDEMPEIDFSDPRLKIIGRGIHAKRGIKFALSTLRESFDLSQSDVAKRAEISQSEASRIEQRDDHLVTTLRRYAKAIGGRLRVYVELHGRQYEIEL